MRARHASPLRLRACRGQACLTRGNGFRARPSEFLATQAFPRARRFTALWASVTERPAGSSTTAPDGRVMRHGSAPRFTTRIRRRCPVSVAAPTAAKRSIPSPTGSRSCIAVTSPSAWRTTNASCSRQWRCGVRARHASPLRLRACRGQACLTRGNGFRARPSEFLATQAFPRARRFTALWARHASPLLFRSVGGECHGASCRQLDHRARRSRHAPRLRAKVHDTHQA